MMLCLLKKGVLNCKIENHTTYIIKHTGSAHMVVYVGSPNNWEAEAKGLLEPRSKQAWATQ